MTKMALIGGGHIHTPNFAKILSAADGVEVTHVWDPDPAVAAERQAATGGEVVDSYQAALGDGVDAVVICSQTDLHRELVLATVDAGKHLFVEKPLGIGAKDAREMADAIDQAGVIFQTGYFMRGSPWAQYTHAAVRERRLGQLTRLRLSNAHNGVTAQWLEDWTWMLDPQRAGVGALGDLGTHVLDLCLWWMEGDPVVAATGAVGTATGRHDNIDEYGEAMLKFDSGAVATLCGGWVDMADPQRMLVSGLDGTLYHQGGDLHQVMRGDGRDKQEGVVENLPEAWPHAFNLFLEAVGGKDDVPLVTAQEAAYRSIVMDAVYRGAREGTWASVG
jgi:predicted dehydrogenase